MSRVTTDDVENSSPDSGDGSVKLISVHCERNYELPLHRGGSISTGETCNRRTYLRSADTNLPRPT